MSVHEDSERVETNPDQDHREEVHERVARGFGEPRGEDDHGQVQRNVAQGTPRVDSSQLCNEVRGNAREGTRSCKFVGLLRSHSFHARRCRPEDSISRRCRDGLVTERETSPANLDRARAPEVLQGSQL